MHPACRYQIEVIPNTPHEAVSATDPGQWHALYTGPMPAQALEYLVWGLVRSQAFARVRVFCTTHPGHVLYDSIAVGVLGLLTAAAPPAAAHRDTKGTGMTPIQLLHTLASPRNGGG